MLYPCSEVVLVSGSLINSSRATSLSDGSSLELMLNCSSFLFAGSSLSSACVAGEQKCKTIICICLCRIQVPTFRVENYWTARHTHVFGMRTRT